MTGQRIIKEPTGGSLLLESVVERWLGECEFLFGGKVMNEVRILDGGNCPPVTPPLPQRSEWQIDVVKCDGDVFIAVVDEANDRVMTLIKQDDGDLMQDLVVALHGFHSVGAVKPDAIITDGSRIYFDRRFQDFTQIYGAAHRIAKPQSRDIVLAEQFLRELIRFRRKS